MGLDERRVARRKTAAAARRHPTAKPAPFTPAMLESRYSFPPGDGAGQTIAIAEFGGGYFPDDLSAYCQKYGLPVAPVTPVPVGLTPLTLDEIRQLPPQRRKDELGATGEVMM